MKRMIMLGTLLLAGGGETPVQTWGWRRK